jgi:hypothetical protein
MNNGDVVANNGIHKGNTLQLSREENAFSVYPGSIILQ